MQFWIRKLKIVHACTSISVKLLRKQKHYICTGTYVCSLICSQFYFLLMYRSNFANDFHSIIINVFILWSWIVAYFCEGIFEEFSEFLLSQFLFLMLKPDFFEWENCYIEMPPPPFLVGFLLFQQNWFIIICSLSLYTFLKSIILPGQLSRSFHIKILQFCTK